jgi:hypothetical protein
MSFSRPIQWYNSHADPIWPDSTFKKFTMEKRKVKYSLRVLTPLPPFLSAGRSQVEII